jgi:hypothetical protein
VDVFQQEDGATLPTKLLGELGHDLIRHRPLFDERREFAVERLGDLQERPQRARREERLARAAGNRRRARAPLTELPDQRGLADPGLTSEQDDVPHAGGLHRGEALGERRQLVGTLEQAALGGRCPIQLYPRHRAE